MARKQMLNSSLNPCIRWNTTEVTLRSLVAIIAICVVLAWAAAAESATVEPGHSTLHADLIGHSGDEKCCTSGFDCQCSPATAIVVLANKGIPSTHDAWSLPTGRRFAWIVADNPYHPPRRSLTS